MLEVASAVTPVLAAPDRCGSWPDLVGALSNAHSKRAGCINDAAGCSV